MYVFLAVCGAKGQRVQEIREAQPIPDVVQ